MRVAIIVPFYNSVSTARWTWQSALAQTYSDLKIVLVNDGSTDENNSWHAKLFAEECSRKHRCCVLLDRSINRGVVNSRNEGASVSHDCDALLFVDADDWIDRDFVTKTVQVMESDPAIAIVATDMHVFADREDSVVPAVAATIDQIKYGNTIPNTSLVRASAFHAAGGYKLGVYEDWELWVNIIAHGGRVAVVNEPMIHYRRSTKDSRIHYLTDRHEELVAQMRALHPEVYAA